MKTKYKEPPCILQVAVKNRKGRTSVCSALFLFLVFSLSFLYAISNNKIEELARKTFPESLSGFLHTLSSPNSGKWFELELALHLNRCFYEDVVGFSLEIRVVNSILVPLNDFGDEFELRTTEYDLVTKLGGQNFVYEAKAGHKEFKDHKYQFTKERNMLLFFKNVYEEVVTSLCSGNETISLKVCMRKRKPSRLIINGNATDGNDVELICPWVTGKIKKHCLGQWLSIIKTLANSSLILAFKRKLSGHFKENLKRNFSYIDEVKYDPKQDLCLYVENLIKEVEALSIV